MNRLNTSFQKRAQSDFRSRSLRATTSSALIICVLSISSCAKQSVTKAPVATAVETSANPNVPRVVLSIRISGGRCAGACNSELSTVKSDGEFSTVMANEATPTTLIVPSKGPGQIGRAEMAEFLALLSTTKVADIESLPKTVSICPSAHDGRDIEIEIMLPAGLVSASNCTVNLETAHPLTTAALKIRTAINEQLREK